MQQGSSKLSEDIHIIRQTFKSSDLTGSNEEIIKALDQFEQNTLLFIRHPGLDAIIKWHKNLYLQKTGNYARSEELLDDALTNLLDIEPHPIFLRWFLKIYLSLGYTHRAQRNYLDAEFYLKEALKIAVSESELTKFKGEIYSLLASINLSLNRYNKARKYVNLEKDETLALYQTDRTHVLIYAYALYDYCKVNRIIGASDPNIEKYLEESATLFEQQSYYIGLLNVQLEEAQWNLCNKSYDIALKAAEILSQKFDEANMVKEYLEAGLLIANIHKAMYDYDQAESKLNHLIDRAIESQHGTEQITADLYYTKGTIYATYNMDREAFDYFRKSTKIGMALGIKSIIIRAFNAARMINPYPAREFITSDLVYQDACFVRNRLKLTSTPFFAAKTRIKLFASTLFLDIVGFSSLMRKSSEDMTVLMIDELIDRLCLIIYQNGGYIDKFLGDGFMAIFEHGDRYDKETAYRSVRSGMDILRSLNHKNRKLRQVYGVNRKIRLRMGLSTGEIYALVLGNYIKREYTYLGNSVNLASKLEGMASKHLMLADKKTYELIRKRILAKKQLIQIPDIGKIEAYELLRLSRQTERGKTV
ncbi:MAG: adenylate/guanylate cyclase domain-containing protein [Desulfobacteraceae bacterium]|jgi:class 3 adenylate cyclase